MNGRQRAQAARSLTIGLIIGGALTVAACGVWPDTPYQGQSGKPIASHDGEDDRLLIYQGRRAELGLRSDEEYVQFLMRDPEAALRGETSEYGFPLTAGELALLGNRAEGRDAVQAVLEEYAKAHPQSWAGQYVDRSSGDVIARFTDNLEVHRAALDQLLHTEARYALRPAEWTLHELKSLAARVRSEEGWLNAIGATLTGTGADPVSNRAVIDVISDRSDIAERIQEHFQAADQITVRVEMPKPTWLGPRLPLAILVQDAGGDPISNLDCVLLPDEPFVGEMLRGTGDDGICRFQLAPATGVTIIIRGLVGSIVVEYGRRHVRVDNEQHVTISIDPGQHGFPE